MKKALALLLAALLLLSGAALAEEEGITLPKEVADAIVTYRATNPIKTEGDLGKVPGVTPQLIQQLYPIEDGDDLLFDPSSMPGMKGY